MILAAAPRRERLLGILILILLLAAALPLLAGTRAAPRAAPALLDLASLTPDASVRVIARVDDAARGRAAAERLGGRVVRDLPMIRALAIEMPAAAAVELARQPAIAQVSPDGPVSSAGKGNSKGGGGGTSVVANTYLDTLRVRDVWAMGLDGSGVTVAVIDSGIHPLQDLDVNPGAAPGQRVSRIVAQVAINPDLNEYDNMGHGTHVAGIVAGNGYYENGAYTGIAPGANLIALNVADSTGMAYESDIVAAMQWVLDNADTHNIRVVNLSINSTSEMSYHESAMDAAAEILWFNGIVVVASSGNKGRGNFNTANTAPANDPFVITVGATDEKGTASRADDMTASFNAHGITMDGHVKPEIVAPGKEIVSLLASNSDWKFDYPERIVENKYFRASGTSMSAPMVSGAVALLLQDEPHLTPDQVKYRLISSAGTVPGAFGANDFYPYSYLDVYAAVTANTTASANTGIEASQLLWSGNDPVTWGSVNWGSVNWGSVNWGSVNWGSVNWGSVNWGSVNWGS